MQRSWRRIAGLLLITMATALSGAQALAFPAAQAVPLHRHPAGCHAPAAPAHAPTSYQCCVNGHNVAIPNALFTLRSMAVQLCSLAVDGPRLNFASSLNLENLLAPANSPPSGAPLRI
jgi:hypothetical protein